MVLASQKCLFINLLLFWVLGGMGVSAAKLDVNGCRIGMLIQTIFCSFFKQPVLLKNWLKMGCLLGADLVDFLLIFWAAGQVWKLGKNGWINKSWFKSDRTLGYPVFRHPFDIHFRGLEGRIFGLFWVENWRLKSIDSWFFDSFSLTRKMGEWVSLYTHSVLKLTYVYFANIF